MPYESKFPGLSQLEKDLINATAKYQDDTLGYKYIYDPPVEELYNGKKRIVSILLLLLFGIESLNQFALFSEITLQDLPKNCMCFKEQPQAT